MRRLIILLLFAWSAAAADMVIRNVTVCDVGAKTVTPAMEIVITGGRIERVQPQGAPTPAPVVIDGSKLVAIPGFIDTHTHLWQHVAKSVAPDKKLQEWVTAVYRGSRYLTPDEVEDIESAAAAEALRSGITTVIDFASVNVATGNLRAVVEGLVRTGVDGAVVYWQQPSFLTTADRIAEIRSLQAIAPGRIEIWMGYGPLSFFPVPSVFDGIATANTLGMRMTEHEMENVAEERDLQKSVAQYVAAHGSKLSEADLRALREIVDAPAPSKSDAYTRIVRLAETAAVDEGGLLTSEEKAKLQALGPYRIPSPVRLLAHLGGLDRKFVSIHSVWQTGGDLAIYGEKGVAISYNPESNMYLSSGPAPWRAWRARNLVVSLGTDGAASNDAIDMFTAMRAAINLQKVETMNAELSGKITPWDVLAAATINGAEAIGQSGRIGAIRAGHEADIVLLSTERLGMSPYTPEDPDRVAALIVNAAGPREIDTVISNGVVRVSKGELVDPEAPHAAALSRIARELPRRVAEGVDIEEIVEVRDPRDVTFYRMVHRPDLAMFSYRNDTGRPLRLTVRFSGNVFGGTVPAALAPETLRRFPEDAPPHYFERTFEVPQTGSLSLLKHGGQNKWAIQVTGKTPIEREGVNVEQIYVSAQ